VSRSRIFVLNKLIDAPTSYPTKRYEGGPEEDLYLLDYNYADQRGSCVSTLEGVCAARHLDFSRKTLLLAAGGLHPEGAALIRLVRKFRTHHVFFELWNGLHELRDLYDAGIENLYFFPVTTNLRQCSVTHVPSTPKPRVFVSLGGDDDVDLIQEVITRCPHLLFCVPDVRWVKGISTGRTWKRYLDVGMSGTNVTMVDCSVVRQAQEMFFSTAYRSAYDSCDVVLIATLPDKMLLMRGGVRLADALYARKHIVLTENQMLQVLMAQHEKTCLVAAHDPDSIAAHLTRICAGRFRVVDGTYEGLRRLTVEEGKLSWMIHAAEDPAAAHASIFAPDHRRLKSEVDRALPPRPVPKRESVRLRLQRPPHPLVVELQLEIFQPGRNTYVRVGPFSLSYRADEQCFGPGIRQLLAVAEDTLKQCAPGTTLQSAGAAVGQAVSVLGWRSADPR
jgi:hypothetical protein